MKALPEIISREQNYYLLRSVNSIFRAFFLIEYFLDRIISNDLPFREERSIHLRVTQRPITNVK